MPKHDPEIERLKQEILRLHHQNLKLTVENEFVKKLSSLVDQYSAKQSFCLEDSKLIVERCSYICHKRSVGICIIYR